MDISVVIPVYRAGDCLAELLRQLHATLGSLGKRYEVLMVDDASPDDSWEVIRGLVGEYECVSGIQLLGNVGQTKATLCGMKHAAGDLVVTMDNDLQHRPDQLPLLLDKLDSEPQLDCVFGWFPEKQHAGYRNVASSLIRRLNGAVFGLKSSVQASAFRVMRRRVVDAVLSFHTVNPVISSLIYSSTRNVASVAVEHGPRHAGESSYSLRKQFRLALDNICNVSMFPLRALTVTGAALCFLCLCFVVLVLWRHFTERIGVPSWTTLSVSIAFFSGMNLLGLGILGEYMVRVLREVRGAPSHQEKERIGPIASR